MVNCTPKLGGQFELESGGQFAPKLVVNLHWNRVVNLTGFSNQTPPSTEKKKWSFYGIFCEERSGGVTAIEQSR